MFRSYITAVPPHIPLHRKLNTTLLNDEVTRYHFTKFSSSHSVLIWFCLFRLLVSFVFINCDNGFILRYLVNSVCLFVWLQGLTKNYFKKTQIQGEWIVTVCLKYPHLFGFENVWIHSTILLCKTMRSTINVFVAWKIID